MHYSQGWVQFGYRFSLDFVPFALILVALGLGRLWRDVTRMGPLVIAAGLIFISILVNAWGVWWGGALGW
jgi:hypothetical protein